MIGDPVIQTDYMVDGTIYTKQQILDAFAAEEVLAQTVTQLEQAKTAREDANNRATENARRLSSFKEDVIQVVVDFESGCVDGKKDFLERIGLEAPDACATVNLTVEVEFGTDLESVIEEISSVVENYAGASNCNLDGWDEVE